jgi:hypothetical protein
VQNMDGGGEVCRDGEERVESESERERERESKRGKDDEEERNMARAQAQGSAEAWPPGWDYKSQGSI